MVMSRTSGCTSVQVKLESVVFLCLCLSLFTTDTPYEVFVSLNGDNGDVYAGQCVCVSG